MIKTIYKYYLKFPPLVRKAVDFSILGVVGCCGVDYYSPKAETILIGCNHIEEKLFV